MGQSILKITFYNKDSTKFISLSHFEKYAPDVSLVCLTNEEYEGGGFPLDEVSDVIYKALEKYFEENF